jgi:uncharacterized membrane protein (UPF0127 family)/ActR/RegA family two-component response regulator
MADSVDKKSDFKVLIIDDEKDFLSSMEFWFRSQGYAVLTASGGPEALDVLKKTVPNIIFLDYLMPGMNGVEVLHRLRRMYPRIPVVMLTAHAREDVRIEAYKHGANGVFDKSLDFYKAEHLINSLVRVVSKERRKPAPFRCRRFCWVALALAVAGVSVFAALRFFSPQVCFGDRCIRVELAVSVQERSQGLMFRSSLPSGTGMLFVFPEEGLWPFWMKNTYMPLDVIWLNDAREVVETYAMALPASDAAQPPSFGGTQKARYVVEAAPGIIRAQQIRVGDKARFKWIFLREKL